MRRVTIDPLDATIRTVAIQRLGVVDASIHPLRERESEQFDTGGRWFGLFVRMAADSAPRMLARRRTKSELLELVSSCGPERLGDWPTVHRRRKLTAGPSDDSNAPNRPQNRSDAPPRPKPRYSGPRRRGWKLAKM